MREGIFIESARAEEPMKLLAEYCPHCRMTRFKGVPGTIGIESGLKITRPCDTLECIFNRNTDDPFAMILSRDRVSKETVSIDKIELDEGLNLERSGPPADPFGIELGLLEYFIGKAIASGVDPMKILAITGLKNARNAFGERA